MGVVCRDGLRDVGEHNHDHLEVQPLQADGGTGGKLGRILEKHYTQYRKDIMLTIPPDWQGVFNPWNPTSSFASRHQACFCHSLPGRTLP